jgi:hypothetical protein
MEIGKPIRTYTVEPLRDPVSQLKPAVARGDRLLERDVRGGAGRPRRPSEPNTLPLTRHARRRLFDFTSRLIKEGRCASVES